MGKKPERETRNIQSIDRVSGSSARKRSTPLDTILTALADEHRRAILNTLDTEPDNTLDYDALVDGVADQIRDEDADGNEVTDEYRQRIRIVLHHTHLPKLEEAQIIDYKADTGHVTFVGGALEQEILTLVESYDLQHT